jgi:hypothetical protein
LKQSDYLLGFISMNKYAFKNTIDKKWLENHTDPMKDRYKSPTLVYCNVADVLVLMVRANVKTPPRMGGFESDNEEKMPKIMIKLSKKVNNDGPRDDEGLVLNVGGSS